MSDGEPVQPPNKPACCRWRRPRWYDWLAIVVLFTVLISLITPRVNGPPARRTVCLNNLKNIGLALTNYHSVHGCYPPAYIADANGKPMHSWRVLLLPHMDNAALYRRYRFDEPWDGPNNRKLHDVVLKFYGCPEDDDRQNTDTNYCVVIGPKTLFRGAKTVKLQEIKDAPSYVIAVVEVKNSGIHWMEPRDLHILQMPMVINPKNGMGISSHHGSGANVLFADGRAMSLPDSTSAATLRKLLTTDDGSPADR